MGKRENDGYGTAAWCVHRALEGIKLPGGAWFEPCAGHGLIVNAVRQVRQDVAWDFVERDIVYLPALKAIGGDESNVADFLETPVQYFSHYDVILTNPPYSWAEEFVTKAQMISDNVVMLLRVNWLGAASRTAFFHRNMPDVYVLPNRPSFKKSKKGNSDSTEYAWLHWTKQRRSVGKVRRLADTPIEVRSKQQEELYKIYKYYYGSDE